MAHQSSPNAAQSRALKTARTAQARVVRLNNQLCDARMARDMAITELLLSGLRPFEIAAVVACDRGRIEAMARSLRAAPKKKRR